MNREKMSPTFASAKGSHPTWGTIEDSKANWTRSKWKRAKQKRTKNFRTSIKKFV